MTDSRMMVMVASLERHLQAERKILDEAIMGQRGIPVGLAYPPIPANYIFKLNQQSISDADYVFLLIGSEYGALTDKGVGYIHATYAAAQAARKPVVSLIYSGDKVHNVDSFDRKRLEGLIQQLKDGNVYYWSDEDSLRDSAERALESITEAFPSVGWIKADLQPLVPETNHDDQNLIQKLKNQVSQLSHKLQRAHVPSQPVDVSFAKDSRPWLLSYQCNAFREGRLKQIEGQVHLPLEDVFEWLSPTLLAPVTEAKVRAILSSRIHDLVLSNAQREWKGSHAVSDIRIHQNSIDDLKLRLRALLLIAFDHHGRWHLTEAGEQLALQRES
ncbi:MAG: DUF4062 domain-containing protein [Reinekea sp.]|nr:DUF4062 domain-containing protein [Reinekea sp.]MDX1473851.1 DUF4062 domain-containing protein [Reinekea sp.]